MKWEQEFWGLVDLSGPSDCWLWTGRQDRKGYGVYFRRPRQDILAHRRAWRYARGEIPTGMCVCHSCDTPLCVNPDHLWLGTRRDNNLDRHAKGRSARGEANGGGRRLTEAAVIEIKNRIGDGHKLAAIAEDHGVTVGMVRHIKHGRAWRHVQEEAA